MTKTVPREKFIAINVYIKQEKPQIYKITLHLKELEQEETLKLKPQKYKGS